MLSMYSEPQRKATEPTNKLSVKIQSNSIIFSSKEKGDQVEVKFHRTLRIPEDGKSYPLPSSMGVFPIELVSDYPDTVPEHFKRNGGVFICIHQRECLTMEFINQKPSHPHAVKVASGKINVLSGEMWDEIITERPVQDYIVTPAQTRLDGINSGGFDKVKQFVAMPLGSGYTLEGQLNHEESVGGIQIVCYNSKKEKRVEKFGNPKPPVQQHPPQTPQPTTPITLLMKRTTPMPRMKVATGDSPRSARPISNQVIVPPSSSLISKSAIPSKSVEMGLSPGGYLKQKVVADPYTAEFWDEDTRARIFIHLVNSKTYTQITGKQPQVSTITEETYRKLNLPWYSHYVENSGSISNSEILSTVKTVKESDIDNHGKPLNSLVSIPVGKVMTTRGTIEKADVIKSSRYHPLRDILPKEILYQIGSFLTLPPLNRLSRCDKYLLEAFFNLTVPKVDAIKKRKEEFKKQGIETALVSMKDQFKEDEYSLVQKLIWKPMVIFYFPNYSESLNIKNWMHVLRRRIVHLQNKFPSALPLKRKAEDNHFSMTDQKNKDKHFIENCEWEYECPLKSTAFKRVSDNILYCHVCKENVYEVSTKEDFDYHVQENQCVSFKFYNRQVRGRVMSSKK